MMQNINQKRQLCALVCANLQHHSTIGGSPPEIPPVPPDKKPPAPVKEPPQSPVPSEVPPPEPQKIPPPPISPISIIF
jgi:hypothetical protein